MLTQAEYAKHRGVSRQAVNRLVKQGKIPVGEDGKINPADADFRLGEDRTRVLDRDDAPRDDIGPRGGESMGGLTKARTATEVYRARIAQLEYEQRVGKLVPIDQVTRAMHACAESLARDIDQLPTFADDLAAVLARDGVRGLRGELKERARQMREAMARSMATLAVEDGDAGEMEAAA